MPQVTLVPSVTNYPNAGSGTMQPWGFFGTPGLVCKAIDGNQAFQTITLGQPDSEGIWAITWRVEGTGVIFDWTNKTVTNIRIDVNIIIGTAPLRSWWGVAAANEALTYSEQVFNGQVNAPSAAPVWFTPFNGMNANIQAAIQGNVFLLGLTHYNHTDASVTVTLDAARIVIDYTDPTGATLIAMEG